MPRHPGWRGSGTLFLPELCATVYDESQLMKPFDKLAPGERELALALDPAKMPAHIAIIMDGNGRWAKRRGLPRFAGHRAGANRVRSIVENCSDLGVKALTLYAFSAENWKRPRLEIDLLWRLLRIYLRADLEDLQDVGCIAGAERGDRCGHALVVAAFEAGHHLVVLLAGVELVGQVVDPVAQRAAHRVPPLNFGLGLGWQAGQRGDGGQCRQVQFEFHFISVNTLRGPPVCRRFVTVPCMTHLGVNPQPD